MLHIESLKATLHINCLLVSSLLSIVSVTFAQHSEKYLFVLWFSLGIPDGSRIQRNLAIIEAEGINHDPNRY